MGYKEEIRDSFKHGNTATKLIYINLAVFLLFFIIEIITKLFLLPDLDVINFVEVNSNPALLLLKPWTLVSYMFVHKGFIHILFNLINLYWFGRLFLNFYTQKQLVGVYILGGIAGALTFIIAFNIFPYFQNTGPSSLIGASASVLAIMAAATTYAPNMEIPLVFIGKVKLKYIALFFFIVSALSVVGENAGGNWAHLGGILAGYFFAISLRNGKDFSKPINKLIDFFVDLTKRKPKMTVSAKQGRTMTDEEWNKQKAKNAQELDAILDKIKQSGYNNLSADEKKKLFEQGKNN